MDSLYKLKNFIFDLDGVLYLLDRPLTENISFVNFLKEEGYRVIFLSNNTFLTREKYAEKLQKMGVNASPKEVFSSAFVTAKYLEQNFPQSRVYIIGEEGLREEIKRCGLKVVAGNAKEKVDFVVVGMDRKFSFSKMSSALRFLTKGARLIGTNPDPTYPTDKGLLPGCGAMVAAIETCSGQKALIVGKPSPLIMDFVLSATGFKKEETVLIGDRLDTDIVLGKRFGLFSVLVLTGVTTREDLKNAECKPDLVVENLLEFKDLLLEGGALCRGSKFMTLP